MDITTVITIGAIVLANIGTMLGLFMWATTHAASATEAHRAETSEILRAIQQEIKDFHGRLCAIEERGKYGR